RSTQQSSGLLGKATAKRVSLFRDRDPPSDVACSTRMLHGRSSAAASSDTEVPHNAPTTTTGAAAAAAAAADRQSCAVRGRGGVSPGVHDRGTS
ncbi:unnamed protein product, partial [Pylaiella littoralis]